MHTLFISDLHLKPQQPEIIAAFFAFLQTQASAAERLYILGDLFEYWIGDDGAEIIGASSVLQALQQLSKSVDCYFIAGNRDFLVREGFSQMSGCTILADESVIDLYGTPTLILHGDSLCTDDIKHQAFRREITTNQSKCDELLNMPLQERVQMAEGARGKSQTQSMEMNDSIMDVTPAAVEQAFIQHDITQMIHGHTHRQAVHDYLIEGSTRQRYVLGDWNTQTSVLIANADGLRIENQAI